MFEGFPRSTSALSRDTIRPLLLGLSIAFILLVSWSAWFALARLPVYETSEAVYLEVESHLPPVTAEPGGVVERPQGAHIAPHEQPGLVAWEGERRLLAEFPLTAQARVRPGQTGWLQRTARSGSPIPVTVVSASEDIHRGTYRVVLGIDGVLLSSLTEEIVAQSEVRVEIDRLTPMNWILRAAGGIQGPAGEAQTPAP